MCNYLSELFVTVFHELQIQETELLTKKEELSSSFLTAYHGISTISRFLLPRKPTMKVEFVLSCSWHKFVFTLGLRMSARHLTCAGCCRWSPGANQDALWPSNQTTWKRWHRPMLDRRLRRCQLNIWLVKVTVLMQFVLTWRCTVDSKCTEADLFDLSNRWWSKYKKKL